jgi:hypothetical protein
MLNILGAGVFKIPKSIVYQWLLYLLTNSGEGSIIKIVV